jgi:dihydrolipoamide dehydrogenase
MTDSYDVIVLGAGPTGENVAQRAVAGGLTAALVEAERVGGECSYWACMPSKALLRPGQALAAAQRVAGAREAVAGTLDVTAVLGRRDSFVHNLDDSSQIRWATDAGIDVVRGYGRLAGPKRVTVSRGDGDRVLTARHAVVVATGSVPVLPDLPGLADVRPWTSREGTNAKEVPGRLVVLGGGVVGSELADAWSALGSRVTLIARSGLLSGFEPFAGEAVAASLAARGVDVRTGTSARRVDRTGSGELRLALAGAGAAVLADELLVATGRRPATDDLGLDSVGLTGGGSLRVDDTGLVDGVDGEWLYAAGDVTGRAPLTHMGKYAARAVGDVVAARVRAATDGEPPTAQPWSRWTATADHAAVPQVVFTDPQVASVGLTERRARERVPAVGTARYQIGDVAGAALFADGYTGTAQLVVDADRRVVLGATFVGPDVAELLHAATIAVVGEVPLDRLWHAVPAYPTISEIWLRLLETYGR